MATRMTARQFVGRDAQLAELEAALADAAQARPSLVFVAGEPGLGKTRLVEELHARARQSRDARVLAGDCVRLGDGELPYAPLVSALRPLARAGDPALAAVSPGARAALATLVPALAGQADSDGGSDGAGDAGPAAQGRVFEALLELVDRLSDEAPVVLTVEDLHWADSATRAFLRFLSANLCGERLLVLASYRPDELHRRHPLLPLLAELEREPRSRRVTLAPFTRDELGAQLRDILGSAPDPGLLERLHRRSDGNPLFAEELLAAGLDGRGPLPPTLRDALTVRVGRLGEDAQELLRLVAVARSIDHPTLAATAPVGGLALRDALRDAVGAHILEIDEDERYRFRHALLREAVGDDLLPGERAELHLRLAGALEALMPPSGGVHRAAAVAHHYLAAGDQPAALAACVRAASLASAVHAYGTAGTLLEHALEVWDRVPDAEAVAGAGRLELLERAAAAQDCDGDRTRMEALLGRALELAEAEGADDVVRSRLLEQLSRARWTLNRQDESLDTLDRSLALLPDGPSAERAERLAAKARYLMLMGRYRAAVEVGSHAIEQAVATGSLVAEGRALNALGVAQTGLGELEAGAGTLRRARSLASGSGDPFALATAAVNLADVLHLAGRTAEALPIVEEALGSVRAILGRDDTWLVLAFAELAFEAGDWQAAATRLAGVSRRGEGVILVNHLLRQAELALGRGDEAAAAESLGRAARAAEGSREPQFIGVLAALRATLAVRQGEPQAGRALVEDGLDAIEYCTEDGHRIATLAAAGVYVEAEIAQHARDVGDAATAADAEARAGLLLSRVTALEDAAGDLDEDLPPRPVEHAHALTARAEHARAAGSHDPRAWALAAAAWEAVGRPYPAAQARHREAEALVLTGDREGAAGAASAAADTAERLGSAWLSAEVAALAARARLALPGAGDAAAGATGAHGIAVLAPEDPFGLTARERQVLALVAGGATNREVGAQLYMAEKTASVHVSRILAKLDVRSRTEAAAVAHRLGLTAG